jgi:hypothetical protein
VTRMNSNRKIELLAIVQSGAKELSRRLGYGLDQYSHRSRIRGKYECTD